MESTAAFYVIVASVIGGYAGWHARRARGMHDDLKTYHTRIPRFRKARTRSSLISVGLVVLLLFLLRTMVTH